MLQSSSLAWTNPERNVPLHSPHYRSRRLIRRAPPEGPPPRMPPPPKAPPPLQSAMDLGPPPQGKGSLETSLSYQVTTYLAVFHPF